MAGSAQVGERMGKMRRDWGIVKNLWPGIFAFCIVFAVGAPDSPAGATTLKNSVRAGDRSGLRLIRPPAAGTRKVLRPWGQHVVPGRGGVRGGLGRRVRPGALDWFWAETDTALSAANTSRWEAALLRLKEKREAGEALYNARGLSRIAAAHAQPIGDAARRHEISEALILAVIAVESAGRTTARSPKGAEGLMQLIPATAARFGVRDSYDPAQNLAGGSAYLDFLLDRFGGDVILALAGYNAGEGAVARHGGVPPYRETRDYVVRVLDALVAAEGLCALPPQGPRRTCTLRSDPEG